MSKAGTVSKPRGAEPFGSPKLLSNGELKTSLEQFPRSFAETNLRQHGWEPGHHG